MNVEEAKHKIEQSGHHVTTEKRLGNDTGTQLLIDCDAQVNVYDTGKWVVQGKNPAPIKAILEDGNSSFRSSAASISYKRYSSSMDMIQTLEISWRPCYGSGDWSP